MNELFGELRAMLSVRASDVDRCWRAALYALIERAAALDPRLYHEQWVPYLSAHTAHWAQPLNDVDDVMDVEAYREAVALAPFARFALHLECWCEPDEINQGVLDLVKMLDFRALERVSELALELGSADVFTGPGYGDCTLSEYLVSVGLKAANLESLTTLKLLSQCVLEGCREHVLAALDVTMLPGLERLEIEHSGDGLGQGFMASMSPALLGKLKALRIGWGPRIMAGELERLTQRAEMSRLEVLELPGSRLGDEGIRALFGEGPGLPVLRVLDVSDGGLTVASVEVLARSTSMSTLEDLDLSEQGQVMELGALLRATALKGLTALRVTKPNRERLQDEPHDHDVMPSQPGRALTIRVDMQEDASLLRALSAADAPFRLRSLSLDRCLLSVDELDALLSARSLSELECLGVVLPYEPEAQVAFMRRLASHQRPWRALCLRGYYELCAQALDVLLREAAFEQLQWLELCLAGDDDGPLLSVLARYPGLHGLSFDAAVVSLDVASFMVNELKQLQWLSFWTGDEAVLERLAQSERMQAALRAASLGHLCRDLYRVA